MRPADTPVIEDVINFVKIYFLTCPIISFHTGDVFKDFFPNNKKSLGIKNNLYSVILLD